MREAERRAAEFQALQADQAAINQAAYLLRQRAVQEQYAGWRHQEVAFAVAMLFDVMEFQLRGLDPHVRQTLVSTCSELVAKFKPRHDAYLAQRPVAQKTVTHKQAGH
jgi:hypothetical protein